MANTAIPGGVKNKAEEVKGKVEDAAKNFGHQVGERADDAATAAGRGMQTVAGTIRDHAPHEGYLGAAADTVSKTIEKGGQYLQNEKFSGMMEDVTDVVRRNPVPTLLLAVGVGFLLSRALSRS